MSTDVETYAYAIASTTGFQVGACCVRQGGRRAGLRCAVLCCAALRCAVAVDALPAVSSRTCPPCLCLTTPQQQQPRRSGCSSTLTAATHGRRRCP